MVTRSVVARKQAFRVALVKSRQTATGFAEGLGVSRQHVYLVLVGKRESPRVEGAISALIRRHAPEMVAA